MQLFMCLSQQSFSLGFPCNSPPEFYFLVKETGGICNLTCDGASLKQYRLISSLYLILEVDGTVTMTDIAETPISVERVIGAIVYL